MHDLYVKQAAEAKPAGFIRVRFGKLRADDLVWSVMEQKYRRADDPEWAFPAIDADVVIYAIRYTGRHKEAYIDNAQTKEKPPRSQITRRQSDLQESLF